jgi:DNA-binding MarR family transcriptional regulator
MSMNFSEENRIVAENVRLLAHVVTDICEKRYLREVAPAFLTVNQLNLLRGLRSGGEMTASRLADLLQISRPAVTKILDVLVDKKYVKRRIPASDRRTIIVTLLPAGTQLVEDYERLRLQQQERILMDFSSEEKEILGKLLERYIYNCLGSCDYDAEILCLQCDMALGHHCRSKEQRGHCHFNLIRSDEKPSPEV